MGVFRDKLSDDHKIIYDSLEKDIFLEVCYDINKLYDGVSYKLITKWGTNITKNILNAIYDKLKSGEIIYAIEFLISRVKNLDSIPYHNVRFYGDGKLYVTSESIQIDLNKYKILSRSNKFKKILK